MSNLDWRKAKLQGKPTLSIVDEGEYRERDAASRWLERNAKAKKPKQRRKGRRS